jgi:hypothetical protein
MFGTALKLLEQPIKRQLLRAELQLERMGDRFQNLLLRIGLLLVAGLVFIAAGVFVCLGGFWGFELLISAPAAAGAMVGCLFLFGLLITLVAFGITQQKKIRPKAVERYEVRALRPAVGPTVDDIGRQIEMAVEQYGALRVTAAAAAAGLIAGVVARRFRQI